MDTNLKAENFPSKKEKSRTFTYKDLVHCALSLGVGAAVGVAELPFGAVPFGFGALCASGIGTPLVYAGLCLAVLREGGLSLFVAYTLCLVLRVLISVCVGRGNITLSSVGEKIFGEALVVRALSAAVAAFGMGLYRLLRGGFLYYDLFGTLICVAVAVLCTLAWSSLAREGCGEVWQTIAIISLCAVCVWALGDTRFYGISLSALVCMFFALVFTNRRSIVFGAFLALISGLCVSLSYAPMFVFGAVCYAFLGLLSPFFGVACSFVAAMSWGIYIGGIGAFSRFFGALLAANLLFFVIERLYLGRGEEVAEQKQEELTAKFDGVIEQLRLLREQIPEELCGELGDMCEYVENVVSSSQRRSSDRVPVLCAHISGKKRSSPAYPDVCGDAFEYFCRGEDTAVAFISDGMGSGEDAARASVACTSLLKILLPPTLDCSDGIQSAARLVNGALCRDNENLQKECTSTLDVGVFDLSEGRADFYKCGAAPTYILRDGRLSTLSAHTLPIGIMKNTDIGVASTFVLPGDTVIMVSDGVCDGQEDCPEFFEYLQSRVLTHSAKQLADAVIDYADAHGRTDDVSTVVIKLEEIFRS